MATSIQDRQATSPAASPVATEKLERLRAEFSASKIVTESPGFYEDFEFIRRETKVPNYLNNYARFVQWQPYTPAHLEHAEQVIHVVVAEMQLAMRLDGNLKSYAEAPLVMSRMLEREGIWNYVVRGAVAMEFSPGSGFDPFSLWAIDGTRRSKYPQECTWLFAPPFQAIDLAVQAREYPYPVNTLLPRIVSATDGIAMPMAATEVLSPTALEEIQAEGLSLDAGLDRFAPQFRSQFAPDFPAYQVTRGDTKLKYIPTQVIAPEVALEQFTGFVSKGRPAIAIYDKEIRPRLLEI